MKALLLLLCALPMLAGERFVTFYGNTNLFLAAGESAEVASGYEASLSAKAEGFQEVQAFRTGFDAPAFGAGAVIAGPANLRVGVNTGSPWGHYLTLRLRPAVADPNATVILIPGTNSVTVNLESSTNLVDWSVAKSVTLENVPAATFFRAKIAQSP